MKKNKKVIFALGVGIIIAGILAVVLLVWGKDSPMPELPFMYNTDRAHCYFIGADGSIYISTSEEAFLSSRAEREAMVRENNYEGILEKAGSTDAKKVQKMYNLFVRVVLRKDYKLHHIRNFGPNDIDDKYIRGNWNGYYYKENREIGVKTFYYTSPEVTCSDQRAYRIVNWMNEVLAEYVE